MLYKFREKKQVRAIQDGCCAQVNFQIEKGMVIKMSQETKKKKKKISAFTVSITIILIATIITALYIMGNNMGLIDSLDFGAGAYYYADIPEFKKYVNGDAYTSETPMWVLMVLFFLWGGLMYKFWSWLERKK